MQRCTKMFVCRQWWCCCTCAYWFHGGESPALYFFCWVGHCLSFEVASQRFCYENFSILQHGYIGCKECQNNPNNPLTWDQPVVSPKLASMQLSLCCQETLFRATIPTWCKWKVGGCSGTQGRQMQKVHNLAYRNYAYRSMKQHTLMTI